MRPQDVLFWVRAQPFRPFRIALVNGRTYDVRHAELMQVMIESVILFTPSSQEGVAERAEMIGLSLIEHIEPLETPTRA